VSLVEATPIGKYFNFEAVTS